MRGILAETASGDLSMTIGQRHDQLTIRCAKQPRKEFIHLIRVECLGLTTYVTPISSVFKVGHFFHPLSAPLIDSQIRILPSLIAMGSRGLEIVRFRGRYYIRWHRYDSYFEGLGAKIVAGIPAERDEYQGAPLNSNPCL